MASTSTPTVFSLKKAMRHLIDFRLRSPVTGLANERIDFYACMLHITLVTLRFKKTSNLALSPKLEKHVAAHQSTGECVEDRAMQLAVDEIYVENGIKCESWAANCKTLQMGET